MVQAFRRSDCPYVSAQFQLEGLDPDARYVVTDYDTGSPEEIVELRHSDNL